MYPQVTLRLKRSPSGLANLFRAFATFGKRRSHAPPTHEATLLGVEPDPERIAAFLSICESQPRETLHLLYPFALCYPLAMRVLANRAMPFSMARVLNTRNTIVQTRPISARETLSLRCRSTPWSAAPKGYEIDLVLEVASNGERIWRCDATYLVRGASAETADPEKARAPLAPFEEPRTVARWRLEPRDRVRFAKVSGDGNGIHIWSWYARRFGFERDFAQPLRVVTRCVDLLPSMGATDWPRRLEYQLKGPVYYGSNLTLRASAVRDQYRFDLYREADPRPCVVGQLGPDPQDAATEGARVIAHLGSSSAGPGGLTAAAPAATLSGCHDNERATLPRTDDKIVSAVPWLAQGGDEYDFGP